MASPSGEKCTPPLCTTPGTSPPLSPFTFLLPTIVNLSTIDEFTIDNFTHYFFWARKGSSGPRSAAKMHKPRLGGPSPVPCANMPKTAEQRRKARETGQLMEVKSWRADFKATTYVPPLLPTALHALHSLLACHSDHMTVDLTKIVALTDCRKDRVPPEEITAQARIADLRGEKAVAGEERLPL